MTTETIVAFVSGVLLPVIAALFGRESLGKWLLASQVRENTALDALVGIVQESIAGWRESASAIAQLVAALEVSKAEADRVRDRINKTMENQYKIMHSIEGRLSALLLILGDQATNE